MSLEQELVSQQISKGYDKQHILDTAEAMRNVGLEIDSDKIETEMERYELLRNYNSQKNNRRQIRKRARIIFENLVNGMFKQLEESDSSVIGRKIRESRLSCSCDKCNYYPQRYAELYAVHIKEQVINNSPIYNKTTELFKRVWYCFGCGDFKCEENL